jgi:hypothetical protein
MCECVNVQTFKLSHLQTFFPSASAKRTADVRTIIDRTQNPVIITRPTPGPQTKHSIPAMVFRPKNPIGTTKNLIVKSPPSSHENRKNISKSFPTPPKSGKNLGDYILDSSRLSL